MVSDEAVDMDLMPVSRLRGREISQSKCGGYAGLQKRFRSPERLLRYRLLVEHVAPAELRWSGRLGWGQGVAKRGG